jgi:hypothetical protein
MIRLGAVALLLPIVLVAACGENEECKQLKGILKKRNEVLGSAHAQASVLDQIEKREIEMEARAKKAKSDLGLDQSESDIFGILEARVKAIPGATITRSTRMESVDESNPHAPQISATLWIVRFQEKDPAKAFDRVTDIVKPPPLVRLSAIIREERTGSGPRPPREGGLAPPITREGRNKPGWRIEILRAVVDEVPINPKPVVLPSGEDLSKVPSGIGSCGAGRLRKQIEDVDAEIEGLRKQAEKTTQLLPASASWEGVSSRTRLLRDTEF